MQGKLSDRLLVSYARDTGFDSLTCKDLDIITKKAGPHPSCFFNYPDFGVFRGLLFSSSSSFFSASHVYVRLGFKTYSVFFNLSPAFFTIFHKS